ncbi:MAG: hypothetical protein JNK23_07365 [Opitutaceae bacterium]|nr:hypothetical protein [Opitutaceae bacterium]
MRSITCGFVLNVALLALPAFAQDYRSLIAEGNTAIAAKDYAKALARFEAAFKTTTGPAAYDLFNGARAAALAAKPDVALDWLEKAVALGWANPANMQSNPDLVSLHARPRWAAVLSEARAKRKVLDAKIDKPLRTELRAILDADQRGRQQIAEIEKQFGRDSVPMRELWKKIEEADRANLAKVTAILDSRGWLGPEVVGSDGSSALFLVIQHANPETQRKYLPMMRAAAKDGRAQASSLALLEDRVALGEGRRQTFGSQIGTDAKTGAYYVLPLEDPDHVDERRASVGLPPLADYVAHWGITWDVEAYKKQLPQLEKRD